MNVKSSEAPAPDSSDAVLSVLLRTAEHHQERSRRNAVAIVRATRELLRSQPFDELTIGEIARQAGTSVGGFYARFASKAAVLEVIMAAVLMEADAALDELESEVHGQGVGPLLLGWASMMVRVFRANRREIEQFALHLRNRSGESRPIDRELLRLRDRSRNFLRSELRTRAYELNVPDPEVAISIASMTGTVTIREAVIGEALAGYGAEIDDERLAREVSSCMAAYLGVGRDQE